MHAPPDLIVSGLALDSRKVEEGFLFFALPGEKEDGGEFIAEAKARGAACAVCEHPPETEIPYILVPDAHKALALCAAVWYGTPAGKLTVVGVTGTNGKTTTTYLIKQLLERTKGAKVGLIGTNQNLISDKTIPTDRTTPDALTVQRLLAQMVDAGCTYAVMEVSSHALMQSRVEGIRFRVGVFTNLTQDHLDYHGTMEAYCDAKSRLFDQCDIACVNGDDAWTERLLARFTGERVTFGQGMTNDLVGWRARYENDCVRFTACTDLDHEETRIGIPGGFSLYNALASLSAVQALGVPLSDPYTILRDVLPAILESRTPFAVIENRREAISFALREAKARDVVVLCGKGHETYQEIGTIKYHLDEREVVRERFAQVQRKDAADAAKENEHEDHHCLHTELRGLRDHGKISGP